MKWVFLTKVHQNLLSGPGSLSHAEGGMITCPNNRLPTFNFSKTIEKLPSPDTNHESQITNHASSMHDLDSSADFDPTRDREFFAAIPARPAVFIVEPRGELTGAQPYLLRTANLRQRLARLLGPPEPASKRLNLREFAAGVRYRVVGSPFELSFLHWQHARRLWPSEHRERLRLRPPAVLKVSLANAYPRCYATRRIGANGFYFGPFSSRRAADAFASGFLDLFKIRRCQIKIRRDPSFPGCIYSEMKDRKSVV